ncbi:MAG: 23S rRNA (adenine(2503)-C(2))-methyltransferase RlmN [Myxococcales bacterium]|nr:23S rRNA (adenine(2503)-C(2))-methyltransferase RlmN [Myxococcales bacterium]
MSALPRAADGRVLLMGARREAVAAWLRAEPMAEADAAAVDAVCAAIWEAIYRRCEPDLRRMRGVDPALRLRLDAAARVDALTLAEVRASADGTRKLLFRTDDGAVVESVLIPGRKRATLCISSQVGCAMRCHFCLTGKMGLRGDLGAAEIVDQVVQARRLVDADPALTGGLPLANVVFMGMGEPLHNPDAVIPATWILVDAQGLDLSARRVTVSTSGIVPAIDRLGAESPARLAVSFNATTDESRDWLMPINRKYPIAALLAAIERFPLRPRERVLVEYVLLAGVNDQPGDAARLAGLLAPLPVKVNLIAFNPHPGSDLQRPDDATVERFRDDLRTRGIAAAIRETRGDETMAACGQLGRVGPPTADDPRRLRRLTLAPSR